MHWWWGSPGRLHCSHVEDPETARRWTQSMSLELPGTGTLRFFANKACCSTWFHILLFVPKQETHPAKQLRKVSLSDSKDIGLGASQKVVGPLGRACVEHLSCWQLRNLPRDFGRKGEELCAEIHFSSWLCRANEPCHLWALSEAQPSSCIPLGWVGYFLSKLWSSLEMAAGAGAALPVHRRVRQVRLCNVRKTKALLKRNTNNLVKAPYTAIQGIPQSLILNFTKYCSRIRFPMARV